jgi:hypothetical protein
MSNTRSQRKKFRPQSRMAMVHLNF